MTFFARIEKGIVCVTGVWGWHERKCRWYATQFQRMQFPQPLTWMPFLCAVQNLFNWVWRPCQVIAGNGISMYLTSPEPIGVGWKPNWLHSRVACNCWGSWLRSVPYLVWCSFVMVLKFLISFKQGALYFHFVLGTKNYVADTEWLWEWFKTLIAGIQFKTVKRGAPGWLSS